METEALLGAIEAGLKDPGLLPFLDLESCLPVSTLQKLNRKQPIQKLVALLTSSHLEAKIGFNQGTEDISITIPLWPAARPELTSQQAIIWFMLGLLPNQAECEELAAKRGHNLLAISCLQLWEDQTGIAFTIKKVDFRLSFLQLRIDGIKKKITEKDGTLYTDNMNTPYRYSPSYARLNGYDPETKTFSQQRVDDQSSALVTEMVAYFWKLVQQRNYFPDAKLKVEVEQFLLEYLLGGLCGQVMSFRPNSKSMALYLHGTAGIGKSSFVTTFAATFQDVIEKYVEPSKRWGLVKIPLNSMTTVDLTKILRVRGISDWSIERIVEQTIAHGGVAILHLEENPSDETLQHELFQQVKKLIHVVTERYSEYTSNLLYIITSNYAPVAESLQSSCRVIEMSSPPRDIQTKWCLCGLKEAAAELLPNLKDIDIHLDATPRETKDMRILERWRLTVGFYVCLFIKNNVPADKATKVKVLVQQNEKLSLLLKIEALDDVPTDTIPPWQLVSDDGFFFLPSEKKNQTHAEGLHTAEQLRALAIFEMLKSNFLKPAVVVVGGPQETKQTRLNALLELAKENFGSNLDSMTIHANTEADKEAIFGNPASSSMGKLFQFLDSVTNQNYEDRENTIGLVVVHANVLGQFMLREILENNDSKTHRTAVKKHRILFVVVVEDEISPQLVSRAHDILLE